MLHPSTMHEEDARARGLLELSYDDQLVEHDCRECDGLTVPQCERCTSRRRAPEAVPDAKVAPPRTAASSTLASSAAPAPPARSPVRTFGHASRLLDLLLDLPEVPPRGLAPAGLPAMRAALAAATTTTEELA